MKKQALALVAASALLLSLAACSSGNSSASGSTTKITFAHWGNQSEADTITSMIAAFEKANPKIQVENQWLQGDYDQQLSVALAGGTGPNVFQVAERTVRQYKNSLQDVKVDSSAYIAQNIPASMQVNGAYKAVPFVAKPKVMAVNNAIFKSAGVAAPDTKKPMSLDQFAADAQQVTSGSGNSKVFGSASLWFEGFLGVNGAWYFNKDATKCALDSPATIKTAQFVIAAQKAGWAPTGAESEGQNMFDWLSVGRVAMQPDFGPWDIAKLAALNNSDINLVPDPGQGEPLEINGLGIGKYDNKAQTEAATTFVNYISTNLDAQTLLTTKKSSLGLPVVKGALDEFGAVAPKLNLDAFLVALDQGVIIKPTPNKDLILQQFYDTVNARTPLGSGTEDPAVVFPTLQAGCQSKLDQLNASN